MAFARALPSPNADTSAAGTPARAGRYAEGYVLPITSKELFTCDEGSYFIANTTTPGTGVIGHAAATTFDEAKALITVYNGGNNRVYPQFIHLHETVAGAGHTRLQMTVTLDTGNRRSSAGTILTIVNANMDSAAQTGVQAYSGAVVTTAASGSRRIIGHQTFRGTIDIIEDDYELVFGSLGGGNVSNSRVATVAEMVRTMVPVCIGPGQTMCVHQWAGSQNTGTTFEVMMGYIER